MSEEEITPSPLDIMFSGEEPEETIEDVVEETPTLESEVVEEPVVDEPEEEVEDDDYDAPVKKKVEETDEDEEPLTESKAIERARAEGKARKALETEKKEWELDRDRLKKERDEFETKLKEFETTKIKPEEHPDFVSLKDEILSDARDTVDDWDAPNKDVVFSQLGSFISDYRNADTSQDRQGALGELKDKLADQMFGEGDSFADLDKDQRKEVSDAVRLLKKSAGKADLLNTLRDDLSKKAQSGTLAVGAREYEAAYSDIRPILDVIGDLPDEAIEGNPYAIESVVASLAKIPEGKKRLESAKKDVVELIYGMRPFSQEEIDKMEANGTDIKAYRTERNKALDARRKKLLPLLVQGLMTRGSFKEMASELSELKKRYASEESEDDALLRIGKKKAPAPKAGTKERSPVDIMFDE
jgi:hypothetical protein